VALQYRKSDQLVIRALHQAITSYYTINQRFPNVADRQTNDLDLQTDYSFMIHIASPKEAKPDPASPTKAPLFAGIPAVKDPKTGQWLNGLTLEIPETGGLFDQRGNLFRIRLDATGDGKVYSPINNQPLNERILIWSAGKDGKFETWRDNARTWK
jgi:hypothetical protein